MTEPATKVKISEKRRGALAALTMIEEGYVQSFDETDIYYHSVGQGSPPLVCLNGLGVSTFFWVYMEKMFRKSHRFITWDYRGHGKSELRHDKKNHTLKALVGDCAAVLNGLKVTSPVLIGHSLGVQVMFEYYRKHPKNVGAMIFCFGTYGHPMDHFYNLRLSRYLFRICYEIGTAFPKQSNLISQLLLKNPLSFWLGGLLKIMHTGMVNRDDMDRYIDHILSVDPLFFTQLLKSAQEHSAEDMLKKIKVPTLIITGEQDQFTPIWISKKMHRLIPDSEILIMPKATHAGLVEQPDLINLRIEKFLKERVR